MDEDRYKIFLEMAKAITPHPETEYLIEKQEKQICFGDPGYVMQWRFWSSHKTASERDQELERLREWKPEWVLRARDEVPKRAKPIAQFAQA